MNTRAPTRQPTTQVTKAAINHRGVNIDLIKIALENAGFWLDSINGEITESNNIVSEIENRGDSGDTIVQATLANRPTYTIDGLSFDGSNDFMSSSFIPERIATYYALVTPDDDLINHIYLGGAAGNSARRYLSVNGGFWSIGAGPYGYNSANTTTNVAAVNGVPSLIMVDYIDGYVDMYIDGVCVISGQAIGKTDPTDNIYIGKYRGGGLPTKIKVKHAYISKGNKNLGLNIKNSIAKLLSSISGLSIINLKAPFFVLGLGQSLLDEIPQEIVLNAFSLIPFNKQGRYLEQATGASSLMQETGESNYWVNNGGDTLSTLAITALDQAEDEVIARGKTVNDVKIVRWRQGNQDAGDLYSETTVTVAEYEAANNFLFDQIILKFPNAKIQLDPITRDANVTIESGWQKLNEIHLKLVADRSDTYIGVEGAHRDVHDGVHMTDEAKQIDANDGFIRSAALAGEISEVGTLGMEAVTATGSGTALVTVTLVHDAGTDFSFPNGDPKFCFKVKDSGTANMDSLLEPTLTTKINSTTFTLTLPRSLTGTDEKLYVYFGASKDLPYANPPVVLDNAERPMTIRRCILDIN